LLKTEDDTIVLFENIQEVYLIIICLLLKIIMFVFLLKDFNMY